jgi:hypothetical protein
MNYIKKLILGIKFRVIENRIDANRSSSVKIRMKYGIAQLCPSWPAKFIIDFTNDKIQKVQENYLNQTNRCLPQKYIVFRRYISNKLRCRLLRCRE